MCLDIVVCWCVELSAVRLTKSRGHGSSFLHANAGPRHRVKPSVYCLVAYFAIGAASVCWSAAGDLVFDYDSARGTLPADQGWSVDSRCLRSRCPSHPNPPTIPGAVSECWFQGQNGNDCTLTHGCGPDSSPAHPNEHFNAPGDPITVTGACTYTEWLAFDDGEDFLDQPFPVALPNRNLTFGPGQQATYWGPHAHPAFGAPGFLNAPSDHAPLRIVTGGGVHGVLTLPASNGNSRNLGKLRIYRAYSPPAGATSMTLVAKLACGNRGSGSELITLGGFGYAFCVGVNGQDGDPQVGRFLRGSTRTTEPDIFGTRTVRVALARPNVWGPHDGEFFTLRVILKNDGTVEAWLNEDPSTHWIAWAGTASSNSVQINPDEQAGTMWVDYVRLYEGAVLPGKCADPVFDINRDGRIDSIDRQNGYNGFLDCAFGPAVPLSTFQGLPANCECHDRNKDGVIDMIDFAVFQRCLTAPDAQLNPGCDE